jgi:hypothetical protein
MNKLILTLFNHERYQSISVIIACAVLLFCFGCSPKCTSLLNPEVKVTETELQGEIALLQSRADAAQMSIDQQKNLQKFLTEQAAIFAAGTPINAVGLFSGIAGILGVGAITDNVRKRIAVRDLEKAVAEQQALAG